MPDWFVAIFTAAITSGAGYLAIRAQYRKDKTDLAEQLRVMASKLTLDLETERTKRRKLETLFDEAMSGIRRLIRQLKDAGLAPCWEPQEQSSVEIEKGSGDD